jgi:acyl-CoA reductase-like NAD-dependent aldehyde dehydrogenase
MTNRHQEHAEKIVAAFREALDEGVRQQIADAQYQLLGNTIRKALGEEVAYAVEQMDAVIRKLRSETERPDLGI